MDIRWKVVLLASLALAGCGGSDGGKYEPEPQEQNGALQAGNVRGVSYKTATRSGTTDAFGMFKYLPGETVTFSIGAIQLGSAPGSVSITPFTLAGLAPPSTEYALRTELDRARRMATPFTRAVNIQFLLMSLDADHNPANGLDVGAQASALANANIDLGLPLGTFAGKVQYLAPNVTRNLPVTRAVVQLYRAVNVVVSAHVSSRETTSSYGGLYTSVASSTYGADGSRLSQGTDFENDGNLDFLYTTGYDALGRINVQGGIQRSVFSSQSFQNTYEYDAVGIMRGGNEDYDYGADGGIDVRYRHNLSVDGLGRRTGDVVDEDDGLDGVIDGRRVLGYGYDTRHNMTSYSSELDYGLDGILEEKVRYTQGFDERDRSTGSLWEIDSNADGVVDSRNRFTYELGSGAFPVRTVYESDFDADGVADYRTITVSTYDAADNELTRTVEGYNNANGPPGYRDSYVFTYDRERRQLSFDYWSDYNADDINDYHQRQVSTYDTAGNPLTITSDYFNADGDLEYHYFNECHHGTGGEQLDCASSTANSAATGGAIYPSADSTLTVENVTFADGVLALAQLYLGN